MADENVLTVRASGKGFAITGEGPAWPEGAVWPGYTDSGRAVRDALAIKASVGGRVLIDEAVAL